MMIFLVPEIVTWPDMLDLSPISMIDSHESSSFGRVESHESDPIKTKSPTVILQMPSSLDGSSILDLRPNLEKPLRIKKVKTEFRIFLKKLYSPNSI